MYLSTCSYQSKKSCKTFVFYAGKKSVTGYLDSRKYSVSCFYQIVRSLGVVEAAEIAFAIGWKVDWHTVVLQVAF